MPRFLSFLLLAGVLSLPAQILPEQFGSLKRSGAAQPAPAQDSELWKEFGFEAGERASYGPLTLSAWRFADPTGSFAAWQSLAARSDLALSGSYLLMASGGPLPAAADLELLAAKLPKRTTSAPPPLGAYLPDNGRIAGSERYLLGRVSLERFEPRLARELVSFERGAEAQTARYRAGSAGEAQVTVVSYPTPQIAIERFRQYQQIWGEAARRSGPIITVVPEAKANPVALKLLGQVSYNPKLSWSEYVPKHTVQDAAKMILAIAVLAGGLILASVAFGLLFGGWKIIARRFGFKTSDEEFTSLHIG